MRWGFFVRVLQYCSVCSLVVFPSLSFSYSNLLSNPHFENGTLGWVFTSGTGDATNNPFLGDRLAYLDPGVEKEGRGNRQSNVVSGS